MFCGSICYDYVTMPKKKEDKIYSVLVSIDKNLKKQNSKKGNFLNGLIRGLGTALGATVLLAIGTTLMVQFLSTLNWPAFSETFFNEVVSE